MPCEIRFHHRGLGRDCRHSIVTERNGVFCDASVVCKTPDVDDGLLILLAVVRLPGGPSACGIDVHSARILCLLLSSWGLGVAEDGALRAYESVIEVLDWEL